MRGSSNGLLLDTCAVIWLANGNLSQQAMADVVLAGLGGGIFVSPVSAWEIGLLARPGSRTGLQFLPDPRTWFAALMARTSIHEARFTPEIAIDSSTLPPPLHGDPADRLLIATARRLGIPIMTRDAAIHAYAASGHVGVVPC